MRAANVVAFGALCGSCAALGGAVAPVAIAAAEGVTQAFLAYAGQRLGSRVEQANCEVEDHPESGELLVLCTARYAPR